MQGRPEFVGKRERVEIRRVNEGTVIVTAGEWRTLAIYGGDIKRGERKGKGK